MNILDFSSVKTHRQLDKLTSDLLIMTRNDKNMTPDMRSVANKLIMKQYKIVEKRLPVRMVVTKHVN